MPEFGINNGKKIEGGKTVNLAKSMIAAGQHLVGVILMPLEDPSVMKKKQTFRGRREG